MFNISPNPSFLSLIKGKSVCIIGPSPHLEGLGMGEFFDSFDIVIRPNNFHIDKELHKDYGSITDIMFHNFGQSFMPGLKNLIKTHSSSFEKLKMLGCLALKNVGSDNHLSWADSYVSPVVANASSINAHKIPFYWIGVPDYKKIYNRVGIEMNTGVMSIIITLLHSPKKLFVGGFSFYKAAGQKYEDIYYKGAVPTEDILQNKSGIFTGHGSEANERQLKICKDLHSHFSPILTGDKKFTELVCG